MHKEKPKYFISIISTLAALISFLVIYLLSNLILALIANFILDLPILGFLIQQLLFFRRDTTTSFIGTFASLIASGTTLLLIFAINKHEPTCKLTCTISGMTIMVVQAISCVINLLSGTGIWINIMQFIAGYIIFSSHK